jgi:hypothetical protein
MDWETGNSCRFALHGEYVTGVIRSFLIFEDATYGSFTTAVVEVDGEEWSVNVDNLRPVVD